MKKIATITGMLALAAAAHAVEFTPAELAELASGIDKMAQQQALTIEQVKVVAPVLCQTGCILTTPENLSKAMQAMVVLMKQKTDAWAVENCRVDGYLPGRAPGSHGGVNTLP